MTTKLDRLTSQREQLEAKIKDLKAALSKQKRAEDTRKKIIIGAIVIDRIKSKQMDWNTVKQWLDEKLEGKDRTLFGLDPKPKP